MSSTEDEDYVYFFFREAAVEYINCGKVCNIFFPSSSDENNDDDDYVDRAICRLCTISPITELSPFRRRINNRREKKRDLFAAAPVVAIVLHFEGTSLTFDTLSWELLRVNYGLVEN